MSAGQAGALVKVEEFVRRGQAAQQAVDQLTSGGRIRAVVKCVGCRAQLVVGPWTTGERALAAYRLGLEQPHRQVALIAQHLALETHGIEIEFENEPDTAAGRA